VTASKQKEYTAIIQKHGEWWIGWVKEVPGVNCQEHTYEELIESLHLGLRDILEYDKEQSENIISRNYYQEVPIYL
jgi:predicted RNase H-like HicB family nuclease